MLLNEKRIRVPQVAAAPVDGDPGVRGDMKMIETAGDKALYVCTTSGVSDTPATLTVAGADANGDITFTAVANTAAGNDISVEVIAGTDIAALTIEVAGNVITINPVTTTTTPTSTANEVLAELLLTPAAVALVTAAADGTGASAVAAAAAANLAGGGDSASVWSSLTLS